MTRHPEPPDPDLDEGPFSLTIHLYAGPTVDLLAARLILVILDELQRQGDVAHIELTQPPGRVRPRRCLK